MMDEKPNGQRRDPMAPTNAATVAAMPAPWLKPKTPYRIRNVVQKRATSWTRDAASTT